jgi:hypothetical protein
MLANEVACIYEEVKTMVQEFTAHGDWSQHFGIFACGQWWHDDSWCHLKVLIVAWWCTL